METMTYDEAMGLVKAEKFILENGILLKEKQLIMECYSDFRIVLATTDKKRRFIWSVRQGRKEKLRINLHYMDDGKVGLFRVDYNSGHVNPARATPEVPDSLAVYSGLRMGTKCHHAHFHVRGYKELAWAMPLADMGAVQKEMENNDDFTNAIATFAKYINLKTELLISPIAM